MRDDLVFVVNPGEPINRFLVGKEELWSIDAPEGSFDQPVAEDSGYLPVEFPAARHYIDHHDTPETCPNWNPRDQTIYWPFERNAFERFSFNPLPLGFRNTLRFTLDADAPAASNLHVTTNGGVAVFLESQKIGTSKVFERIDRRSSNFPVRLAAGKNRFTLVLDAYLERESFLSLEIRFEGQKPVKLVLENVEGPEQLLEIESLLRDLSLSKTHFDDEDIMFETLSPPSSDVPVEVEFESEFMEWLSPLRWAGIWRANTKELRIPRGIAREQFGFKTLRLTALLGNSRMSRALTCEIFRSDLQTPKAPETLQDRKQAALGMIAAHGQLNIQRLIAFAALGQSSPLCDDILKPQMDFIASGADCGDFFLVPLLALMDKYPGYLNKDQIQKAKDLALNWRYWIDEPGNDVRWYFSENHALTFHTAQLLAGELWPDAQFTRSGRVGSEQAALATTRLTTWFDRFEKHGLSEWNSMTYIPVDCIGLFGILLCAKDATLRNRARAALDTLFDIIARMQHGCEIAASQGRIYEKDIKGRRSQETTFLSWIAWGQGFTNNSCLATALFSISDYAPPGHLSALTQPLENKERLTVQTVPTGSGEAEVKHLLTPGFAMSTACNFKPGAPGWQEHIFNLSIAGDPKACLSINHPGDPSPTALKRPNLLAGNGILPKASQNGNTAILQFQLPEDEPLQFSQLYCPVEALDHVDFAETAILIRHQNCFVAIHGENAIERAQDAFARNHLFRQFGRNSAWHISAVTASPELSFDQFKAQTMSAPVDFSN